MNEGTQMMKALRAHKRGGPEQLVYEDAPRPVPEADEVLVRVEAASITADELTWPDTWEFAGQDRTPIIPSHEFSGTIAEVGEGVSGFTVGDAVFGLVPFDINGAAAEYVAVPRSSITQRDARVSAVDAAAAVLPALTALEALTDHVQLAAGQRLLVRGGVGAVGAMLTQIGRVRGADVTVTVSSERDGDRAKQLGANHVLVVPRGATPAGLDRFDAVVDAVGDELPRWMYEAVSAGGSLVTLQMPPNDAWADELGIRTVFFVVMASPDRLTQLNRLLADRRLAPTVSATFPLAEGRAAYTAAKQPGRAPGKMILLVAENTTA